ncbi:MAG: SDR family oxidoreductase [Solobacterium sp.]|jgi:short-subunit dehydrogenase|nr:SDR family oxidoreductase [Solobacterium sp.]MCH4206307.1 SDR family oxidoreductase [Solobacterium sp.]MCH4227773.1 SDR family oxidoreductase [Solobacterium sp.]MCH4283196.1 SDR family oxidoreductase [Solobacterium sp.]
MKKVLITGGSEGIGLAFSEAYALQKCELFLCARQMDRLQKVKEDLQKKYSVTVHIYAIDLSEDGAAEELYRQLKDEQIDILINNAGCGYAGAAVSIALDKEEAMMHLNMIALTVLTKLFAAEMAARGTGIIMNVASTGAFQPGPYIASYYASKAFVLSYTRALKEELKHTDLQIYCLCPGPIDTDFYEKSGSRMSGYHMSAQDCVRYALGHMRSSCILIPGFLNRILYYVPSAWKMKWLSHHKK